MNMFGVYAVTLLTCILASTSPATAQATGSGLPLDLSKLEAASLSPVQKARLGLRLYRQEMLNPTKRSQHPFDYQTHDYVLAEITRKLAAGGADVPTLKKVWETANPGEVKSSLGLFLLLKGDRAAKEATGAFLLDRRSPLRLRELAATALGGIAVKDEDPQLARILAQAAREDNGAVYKPAKQPKADGPQLMLVYPVRRAAVEAIQKLEKKGVLLDSYVTAVSRLPLEVPVPTRPGPAAPAPGGRQ